eukprot:SAG11_NODE_335_length_10564_cov_23.976015_9_plen_39_part_00
MRTDLVQLKIHRSAQPDDMRSPVLSIEPLRVFLAVPGY